MVDANYKFSIIDLGGYGKSSDGGLFTRSILGKSLEANTLNIPNSKARRALATLVAQLFCCSDGEHSFIRERAH